MPWKIVPADYDAADPTTLHDDELIAMERALRQTMGQPQNEYNAGWRAWRKVRTLAERCTGGGDPVELLPPGASASPRWEAAPGEPGGGAPTPAAAGAAPRHDFAGG